MIRPVRDDGSIETGGIFVPVPRRRVTERIASAAMQRIVLLIAPAGYGKSVALRQYLDSVSEPRVVFDVLPEHTGLLGFLRGLTDALAEIAPDARTTLAGAYERNAGSESSGADLAMWLHSHIKSYRGIIAIDDLHNSQEEREVTRFVASLIERTKGRVQWIIASRSTYGLPIGTWLAYGESDLAVDEHDLKFSVEDSKDAARAFRLGVREEELGALLDLTDGWPTAMVFALRSSTRSVDLRSITSMTREMIFRFLAEQIYQGLTKDEREFLEASSLLSEINVDVMVALGFDRAAGLIEDLRHRVSFVHEQSPGAYRLHDLFREFMLYELSLRGVEHTRQLRLRFASVFDSRGDTAQALRLYAEADARELVLAFLKSYGLDLISRNHADIVKAALAVVDEVPEAEGLLLGLRGLVAISSGQYEEGERLLLRAAKREDVDTAVRGDLLMRVAASRGNRGGDPSEILESVVAGAHYPHETKLDAYAVLALLEARTDREDAARAHIGLVEPELRSIDEPELRARLCLRLGLAYLDLRDTITAKPLLVESTEIAAKHGLWSITARAYVNLAQLSMLDNDPHLCLHYAQQATTAATKAGDTFDLQISLLQVLGVETRRGNVDRAAQVERQLGELRGNDAIRAVYIASSQAHRHAWAGHFAEAHRIFGSIRGRQAYAPDRALNAALHALCLALDDRASDSGSASEDAMNLIRSAKPKRNGIGAMVYESATLFAALAEAMSGRYASSARILKRAALTTDEGMNCMRSAVEMLAHAAQNPAYVMDDIESGVEALRNLGLGGFGRYLLLVQHKIECQHHPEQETEIRLTPNELRIIRMLASGMNPKDIAADMGRSVFTIRTHIQNLATKLNAHDRNEAVAAARRLGLVDNN